VSNDVQRAWCSGTENTTQAPRRATRTQLGEDAAVVLHVLDDVERAHEVERPVAERQRRDVAQERVPAAFP
jgi:hypothetical protein